MNNLSPLFIVFLLITACSEKEAEVQPASHLSDQALTEFVEGMNAVLPQRVDNDTYFDSLSLRQEGLFYYYSIRGFETAEDLNQEQSDSLMAMAESRIPCTLWRPHFMQGVDVSFVYLSPQENELIRFKREQQACQ
ncbi:MAG: hypothetical protein EA360_07485 [Balneolaceae bacterium]|nr:MAG: hypothetical protein EA360_07485 [Balneolaceae bacterium]